MTDTSNIDEEQLTRAFNDIVKCLDDTDDERGMPSSTHHTSMFITPIKSSSGSICSASSDSILSSLLPKTRSSSPTHKKTLDARAVGGPSSASLASSPCPQSSSFKGDTDDWPKTSSNDLWRHTSTSSTQMNEQPAPSAALPNGGGGDMPPGIFVSASPPSSPPYHLPPGDYVCRLCNVHGHWLKDCHLYTPHHPTGNHPRSTPSTSNIAFASTTHRSPLPPGNYVCRLCGVPGHWIEDCHHFEPRSYTSTHTQRKPAPSSTHGATPVRQNHSSVGHGPGTFTAFSTPPPASYVCKLCDLPGHWIQQCANFVPIPPRKRH